MTAKKTIAKFVDPMLLLRSASLPDDDRWIREIKLDGYRAIAFKTAGKVQLRSRNDNDMAARYPAIARALAKMRDETVLNGELAALDADGHPSFNLLQNYGNSTGPLVYFIFDVLVLAGRDLKKETLETRRGLLEQKVMPKLAEASRSYSYSQRLMTSFAIPASHQSTLRKQGQWEKPMSCSTLNALCGSRHLRVRDRRSWSCRGGTGSAYPPARLSCSETYRGWPAHTRQFG